MASYRVVATRTSVPVEAGGDKSFRYFDTTIDLTVDEPRRKSGELVFVRSEKFKNIRVRVIYERKKRGRAVYWDFVRTELIDQDKIAFKKLPPEDAEAAYDFLRDIDFVIVEEASSYTRPLDLRK